MARIERARPTTDTWTRRSDRFISELSPAALDKLAFRRGRAIVAALPEGLTLGLTRRETRDIINVLGNAHLNRARRLREAERRRHYGCGQ